MRTRRGCVPVCVTAMALCLIQTGFQADEAVAQRTPRLPSATSAVHRVNSADLYVETLGSGPPLVLLHGFFGCGATWAPHIERLAERFQLIVPVRIPAATYAGLTRGQLWIVPNGDHVPIFGSHSASFQSEVLRFLAPPR